MSLIVPCDISQAVANLVRATALSQFPSWRPIGYKFDSKASVLSAENILEDPISINSEFSALKFIKAPEALNTVYSETYAINGETKSSDIAMQSAFKIVGDYKLLTSLVPVNLRVYYLFSAGIRSEAQNRSILPVDSNLVIFNSRHTSLDSIGASIQDRPDGDSEINFLCQDPEIITAAYSYLQQIFTVSQS